MRVEFMHVKTAWTKTCTKMESYYCYCLLMRVNQFVMAVNLAGIKHGDALRLPWPECWPEWRTGNFHGKVLNSQSQYLETRAWPKGAVIRQRWIFMVSVGMYRCHFSIAHDPDYHLHFAVHLLNLLFPPPLFTHVELFCKHWQPAKIIISS